MTPMLMVCLRDGEGVLRTATCDLPATFTGVGAITVHFGDWSAATFHVHGTPKPMDRRQKGERRGIEIQA